MHAWAMTASRIAGTWGECAPWCQTLLMAAISPVHLTPAGGRVAADRQGMMLYLISLFILAHSIWPLPSFLHPLSKPCCKRMLSESHSSAVMTRKLGHGHRSKSLP